MIGLKDTQTPGTTVARTRTKNKRQTVIPPKHCPAANTKLSKRWKTREEDYEENTQFASTKLKP
jgi:hypothetical protein